MSNDAVVGWRERLERFVPDFLAGHPVLAPLAECGDVVLHGSTTRGIDDASSDIDLWWLLSSDDLARLDGLSPTRFFDIGAALGKAGHLNAEPADAFRRRIERVDLPLIAELRSSVVVRSGGAGAEELLTRARLTMPPDVRRSAFFHHYLEMRGAHRSSDTPMDRGDAVAVLLGVVPALGHALRAALILEALPFPYDKWLWADARRTATGEELRPHVEGVLSSLHTPTLAAGPHPQNVVNQQLRAIRGCLVDRARRTGIDEPWLDKWWLHITQAREALASVRWPR